MRDYMHHGILISERSDKPGTFVMKIANGTLDQESTTSKATGEFGAAVLDEFIADKPAHEKRHLIIDMTDLEHLSSTAIGILMTANRKLLNQGEEKITLAGASDFIREKFSITMMDRAFDIAAPDKSLDTIVAEGHIGRG